MSKIETTYLNFYTLLNVEKEVKYYTTITEEECHGYHTFIEHEEISNEVCKVVIKVLGQEIDITDRLSKKELEILDKLHIDDTDFEINDDKVY